MRLEGSPPLLSFEQLRELGQVLWQQSQPPPPPDKAGDDGEPQGCATGKAMAIADARGNEILSQLQSRWASSGPSHHCVLGGTTHGLPPDFAQAWQQVAVGEAEDQTASSSSSWVVRKGSSSLSEPPITSHRSGGAAFPDLRCAVVGYVVHRRRASRKLLFLDIVEDPAKPEVCLELITKIPNLEEAEVQEVIRAVSRKDLVLAEGWLELQAAKDCPSTALINLQVLSVAVLRPHIVRVTANLPAEEAARELELDKAVDKTRVSKRLLSVCIGGPGSASAEAVRWGLCRAWALHGGCPKKATGRCEMRHHFLDDGEKGRMQWLQERSRELREGEADKDDPFEHNEEDEDEDGDDAQGGFLRADGGLVKLSASMRAEVFVGWLVECFGLATLAAGSGTVDVAGGRGAVAFELSVKHGIPCTVVDPRPIKWSRRQRTALRRAALPEEEASTSPQPGEVAEEGKAVAGAGAGVRGATEASRGSLEAAAGAISAGGPSVLTCAKRKSEHMGDGQSDAVGHSAGCEAAGQGGFKEAATSLSAPSEASGEVVAATTKHRPPRLPQQHQCLFNSDWQLRNSSLLEAASALVGMHPDQATEAIVDEAIAAGKPFAVVPCCVFPRIFGSRKLPDGSQVVTYKQFVDYLLAKDKRICLAYLPFVGRNKVLYIPP
eukprot:CAMPEP_0117651542 /NCGR_PEP_ID=MMETSP0804-20121206/2150_1 /TAXON_ID=1074897 /ORGANISM="Tetraselmis astigmatica, Strain CCMP880" /LENGTH=663 /DNA_ID=CAMNT_0005457531 /DNA_START=197 /DNA_END=2191 /DNA_ORIENTATION=+